MKTTLSVEIDRPIEAVWAEAIDFGSHHEWMSDALAIDFGTDQRTGVGTVLLVATRVGPLRTLDRFTITLAKEPHLVRGIHEGAVSGLAEWTLSESNGVTTFTWQEQLPLSLVLWRPYRRVGGQTRADLHVAEQSAFLESAYRVEAMRLKTNTGVRVMRLKSGTESKP